MVRAMLFAGTLLGMTACASPPKTYAERANSPTPVAWTVERAWLFDLSDLARSRLGNLTLQFTDTPTSTCFDGPWWLAEVLRSSGNVFGLGVTSMLTAEMRGNVAYRIEGTNLVVNLNVDVCDYNVLLYGEIEEMRASGRVDHSYLVGGKQIGWFRASPIGRDITCLPEGK